MRSVLIVAVWLLTGLASATSGSLLSVVNPPAAGAGDIAATTWTHIVLDGARQGDIRLGRPQSIYWIDVNQNKAYSLTDDVALTSVGLWVGGVLIGSATGAIRVADGSTTVPGVTKLNFTTSGTSVRLKVANQGSSTALVTVGLTQEAETSLSLIGTGGGGEGGLSVTTTTIYAAKLLYDNTMTTNGSWDVTNIDQSYKHLEILLSLRGTVAAATDNAQIALNNDATATNYRRAAHNAGALHAVSATDDRIVTTFSGDSAPSRDFSSVRIAIQDYASTGTRNKIVEAWTAERNSATAVNMRYYMVHWESDDAISRITIEPDGSPTDLFAVGSSIQVVGIKQLQVVTSATGGGGNPIAVGDGATTVGAIVEIEFATSGTALNLAVSDTGGSTSLVTIGLSSDLTDGGGSALHYHVTDRARANHTGTQTASTISDFNEAAQDTIGGALQDGATINFTYSDSGNTISAEVTASAVNHATLGNLNSASYTHLTAANHTDLTDGTTTTLHVHAVAAHTQTTNTITGIAEWIEDKIGAALVDSASVNFTYSDAGSTVTAVVLPAGIVHSSLGSLNTTTYTHLTATNSTDLTDAGDSALHYHSTDRARTNHTGTDDISDDTNLTAGAPLSLVGDQVRVSLNTDTTSGVVSAGTGSTSKVWKTNGSGVPAWRDDASAAPGAGTTNWILTGDDLETTSAAHEIGIGSAGAASGYVLTVDDNVSSHIFFDGRLALKGDLATSGNLRIEAGNDIRPRTNSTSAINFAQADGTKFVTFDSTNKRVGVGMTPAEIVDVSLSQNAQTKIQVMNTNAGASAMAGIVASNGAMAGLYAGGTGYTGVSSWQDSGVFYAASGLSGGWKISAAAGGIGFSTDADVGTAEVTINTSGYFGVGDSTPAYLFTVGSGDKFGVNSDGVVTAAGGDFLINSAGNVYLNAAGPDADSLIYFYEDGSQTGESLKWDNADDRFEFSDDLAIAGYTSPTTYKNLAFCTVYGDVVTSDVDYIRTIIGFTQAGMGIDAGDLNAQPDVPRSIRFHLNIGTPSGGHDFTVTIDGINADGEQISEVHSYSNSGPAEYYRSTDRAFALIQQVTISAGGPNQEYDGEIEIGTNNTLGLPNHPFSASTDVYKVKKNSANLYNWGVAGPVVSVTYGTVNCGTIVAGDDFTFWYRN